MLSVEIETQSHTHFQREHTAAMRIISVSPLQRRLAMAPRTHQSTKPALRETVAISRFRGWTPVCATLVSVLLLGAPALAAGRWSPPSSAHSTDAPAPASAQT